ncbi:DNA polymerase zeta catalytic subunit [Yarrowia sp. C11]|nr:DNA polymerase zeta catalytic subunit [Yarrowia sp. E02]KAG5365279.1 DNA polymerase zeta catalytic subunit [Yarrowia sp. C11]
MSGLRIQINYIDYVMAPPGPLDWNSAPDTVSCKSVHKHFSRVPVLRIFGGTSDGLSCCAHVHNVFQYFFIPYTGSSLSPEDSEPLIADLYSRINVQMRLKRTRGEKLGDDCSYVANIVLCKATPFYGYHEGWSYYLKVCVVDPSHVGMLVDMFRKGTFGWEHAKVHECHLSYILQFFCDYNLHGCGWLEASRYVVRRQGQISKSELEVDLQAEYILNRLVISNARKPGDKAFHSLKELWTSLQSTRDKFHKGEYKSDYGERRTTDAREQWFSAQNMFSELEQKVSKAEDTTYPYAQFWPKKPYDSLVPTAFEATKCMFKGEGASLVDSFVFDVSFDDLPSMSQENRAKQTSKKHSSTPPPSTRKQKGLNFKVTKPGYDVSTPKQTSTSVSVYTLKSPPSRLECLTNLEENNMAQKIYTKPHYSRDSDVPTKTMTHGGVTFRLLGSSAKYLPFGFPEKPSNYALRGTVELTKPPPSREDVVTWLGKSSSPKPDLFMSQIAPPTQKAKFSFPSQNTLSQKNEAAALTVMSMEIHVNTREGLNPDPQVDPVLFVVWHMLDGPSGVIINSEECPDFTNLVEPAATVAKTEAEMIGCLQKVVENHDPDILTGFEVQASSWGYILDRCKTMVYPCEFGRVQQDKMSSKIDTWGARKASGIKIVGRHVLNLWRMIRSEVALLKYTLENVVFHVLHERTPFYTHETLTEMCLGSFSDRKLLLEYKCARSNYNLRLLSTLEIVARTAEQARVVGIEFSSVYTRGSQYKVESFLARLTKSENFMLSSPSREQVGQQNALECIALVMEPESRLYTSPVLVLDFQSLYPSVIMAHNYCYSTCLGKWTDFEKDGNTLGTEKLFYKPSLVKRLLSKDDITISPNGLVFVKPHIRVSLLARMLGEILETRFMVKDTAKLDRDNVSFQRLNHNRQLALKLVANVTYGYTSASFSGRMPCAEIADAIVQSGRETLEKCIDVIHGSDKWAAKVVYGDTDSLFVCLPGRTKDEAFKIGAEIADTITGKNPAPMKLQFEKVYLPCMLISKKRYVGYKWEYPKQQFPIFDAKGIETVRRDGTPAAQKIEEKALRILFDTADLSLVKSYLYEQWTKILTGKVSIQDFCFAKEVKLGQYKEGGILPAGAKISAEKMAVDMRFEPQYKERIPYVVVAGPPKSRLIDRCVSPEELVRNANSLTLDADYYIHKTLIPPLDRFFNCVGASTLKWYEEMPKKRRYEFYQSVSRAKTNQTTLKTYVVSSSCIVCKTAQTSGLSKLCVRCESDTGHATYVLNSDLRYREKRLDELNAICAQCSGDFQTRCESQDCPIYYSRVKAVSKAEDAGERLVEWLEEREREEVGCEEVGDQRLIDW